MTHSDGDDITMGIERIGVRRGDGWRRVANRDWRRRFRGCRLEALEDRSLLTINALAAVEAAVKADGVSEFTLSIHDVGQSNATVAFLAHATAGSTLDPGPVKIQPIHGGSVTPLFSDSNDGSGTDSRTVASLAPGEYLVTVGGESGTSGAMVLYAFLPGDLNADGMVSESEQQHTTAAVAIEQFGLQGLAADVYANLGIDPQQIPFHKEADANGNGVMDPFDASQMNANRTFTLTGGAGFDLGGDMTPPTITAELVDDTGSSDSDGYTNSLAVNVSISDSSLIASFRAGLDGTDEADFADLFAELGEDAVNNDGAFTLDQAFLERVLNSGSSLANTGPRTIRFVATDALGNAVAQSTDVNFTLDTLAPGVTAPIDDQSTLEDTDVEEFVDLANVFSDPDEALNSGMLSFTTVSSDPALVDASGNPVTLDVQPDAVGTATVTATATDLAGNMTSDEFDVMVTAVNDAPTFLLGSDVSSPEDTAQELVEFATDLSPGGGVDEEMQALTFLVETDNPELFATPPMIDEMGTLTYEPAENATGSATVTVTLMDDGGTDNGGVDTSEAQMFQITITPVADPPMGVDDDGADLMTDEDTPLAIEAARLLANDTDPDDGEVLSIFNVVATSAMGAIVTLNDSTVTYDPTVVSTLQSLKPGEMVTDTFGYTVQGEDGLQAAATVTVIVTGVNDGPTGGDVSVELNLADGMTVTVSQETAIMEVTDPEGDDFTFIRFEASPATVGLLTDLGMDGVEYDANGEFASLGEGETGTDEFRYVVEDEFGAETTGTVIVTITGVNEAPVAMDDANDEMTNELATDEDTPLDIDAAVLLANDTDMDVNDVLTIMLVESLSDATVTLNGSIITFDPTTDPALQSLPVDDVAISQFTYTISDGIETSTATVTVTVNGLNDAPTPMDDELDTTEDENVSFSFASLVADDTDPDTGDVVTPVRLIADPLMLQGEIVELGGNEFEYRPNDAFQFLDDGETETEEFSFEVMDNSGALATSTVTVTINGVNDAPVAMNDNVFAINDAVETTLTVLENDTDAENQTLTIVSFDAGTAEGTIRIADDGFSIIYEPPASLIGQEASEAFTYTIEDTRGEQSTATATVQLQANLPPDAMADMLGGAIDEDTLAVIGAASLLENDFDAEGDDFSIVAVTNSAAGASVMLVNGGTSIQFDPTVSGALQALPAGLSMTDTFTYTIEDTFGGQDTVTVTLTVAGLNDAPVAVDDMDSGLATDEDTTLAIDPFFLLGNDSDVDMFDGISPFSIDETSVMGASISLSNDFSTITYDPTGSVMLQGLAEGATVNDTFTYTIVDMNDATATATVTIEVTGVNDAPVVVAGGIADLIKAMVNPDMDTFDLTTIFDDPDGDALTFGGSNTDANALIESAGVSMVDDTMFEITYAAYQADQDRTDNVAEFMITASDGVESAQHSFSVELVTTTVIVRPIAVSALSTTDEIDGSALPSSLTQVEVGTSYFVEIWIQDELDATLANTGPASGGVFAAAFDVEFDPTLVADVATVDVSFSSVFTEMQTGTVDNGSGTVENFGAQVSSGSSVGVVPNFVRLGAIAFEADAEGLHSVSLTLDATAFGVERQTQDGAGMEAEIIAGVINAMQIVLQDVTVEHVPAAAQNAIMESNAMASGVSVADDGVPTDLSTTAVAVRMTPRSGSPVGATAEVVIFGAEEDSASEVDEDLVAALDASVGGGETVESTSSEASTRAVEVADVSIAAVIDGLFGDEAQELSILDAAAEIAAEALVAASLT